MKRLTKKLSRDVADMRELYNVKRLHGCRPPKSREMRGIAEASWRCCECDQVWDWMRTYAGNSWSRRPEWVGRFGRRPIDIRRKG